MSWHKRPAFWTHTIERLDRPIVRRVPVARTPNVARPTTTRTASLTMRAAHRTTKTEETRHVA